MQLVVPRDPRIASLPRRTIAGLIDAGLFIAATGAGGVGAFMLSKRLGRRPGWFDGRGPGPDAMKRWNLALTAASAGLTMAGRNWRSPGLTMGGRNWRSPGMRLLGLQRVDVRSRGPVNIHGAVVASAVDTITTQAGRALDQPSVERYRARQATAAQEVTRIREADSGADPEAIAEQTMDVYRRHNVGCGPLAWRTPAHLAAVRLPALRSGRHQTLTEWLAGTVVIDDR